MSEQIQILVDQIVAAVFEENTSARKRYYLQQSLLSLAQAAYLTGIQEGRREIIKDINIAVKLTKATGRTPSGDFIFSEETKIG